MQVHDRLAGGLAVVDADVVAVRGKFPVQGCLRLVQSLEHGGFFDGFIPLGVGSIIRLAVDSHDFRL